MNDCKYPNCEECDKEDILQIAKPILFNTDMVQAILDDRKTVTRRLVKPRYRDDEFGFRVVTNKDADIWYLEKTDENEMGFDTPRYINPPYQIGDYLYVRETWTNLNTSEYPCYYYKASDELPEWALKKWRPSIHMPKEAARIFLRVTDVRVERLQDMTEHEAELEGCSSGCIQITGGPWGIEDDPDVWTAKDEFIEVWNSTITKKDLNKYGWEANPWVWVIEFERLECLH